MLIPLTTLLDNPVVDSKPTIVLVHGAFANASSWGTVVPILQKDGYTVTCVQHPMSTYADDVATTQRVVDQVKGPVVLVGHSYGGAIISGVASDKVKALVFICAFAPDKDETLAGLQTPYPAPPLAAALVPDSAGYLTIDPAKFHSAFAADLPESETRILATMQGGIQANIFATPMPAPTWKTIPSWYLVGKSDGAINPDLERFFAKRLAAKTVEVEASHVPMLSQPKAVAKLIEDAAKAAGSK